MDKYYVYVINHACPDISRHYVNNESVRQILLEMSDNVFIIRPLTNQGAILIDDRIMWVDIEDEESK